MRASAIVAGLLVFSPGLQAQKERGESLSRERGQVETQPPSQSLDRGRLGAQPGMPQGPSNWYGVMVDAACHDRSLQNLLVRPTGILTVQKQPVRTDQAARRGVQSGGISVSPDAVRAERAEAALPDTPDHASRYPSASCAITGDTTAFALLLPTGLLLNLDEGGNTFALEAFQDTSAGREILDGKIGGLKPRTMVKGLRQGDRLKTQSVVFQR